MPQCHSFSDFLHHVEWVVGRPLRALWVTVSIKECETLGITRQFEYPFQNDIANLNPIPRTGQIFTLKSGERTFVEVFICCFLHTIAVFVLYTYTLLLVFLFMSN